ncbi:hypothetical protein Zmor_002226 [Zophobas morio]|uniref:Transmembrane protein n=1 Tax=Zophobas morio TaxID=2755281 RepID=A0AA38J0K4_9CUCU|nr:hypothetical protein Zmor_002226 [Zophobas morio]
MGRCNKPLFNRNYISVSWKNSHQKNETTVSDKREKSPSDDASVTVFLILNLTLSLFLGPFNISALVFSNGSLILPITIHLTTISRDAKPTWVSAGISSLSRSSKKTSRSNGL